jgi:tRNA dimethylallyltransferase
MQCAEDHNQGKIYGTSKSDPSQEDLTNGLPPLIVILGPTAVGKTEVAIQLAEQMDGEIVSADSRLLYRGMDIGTAKPSRDQRRRIPHHLIDVANPDQIWSLAQFQAKAHQSIEEIHSKGRLPFLVGGTGQYLRAITEAWQIPKIKPDQQLRKALENWSIEIGADGLHRRLATIDPGAAAKIDYRNLRRTTRALEVILRSGKLFSKQRTQSQSPYRVFLIGLTISREKLYARIDSRIDDMLAAGLVAEVKGLLDYGYSPDLPPFSAIGYQEIIDHLLGRITLEEAVMLIKRHTRQFVRRQANWFKDDDPDIHWIDAIDTDLAHLEANLQNWLNYD